MPTFGIGSGSNQSFVNQRFGMQQPGSVLSPMEQSALTERVMGNRAYEAADSNIFTRTLGYAAASVVDLGDTIVSNNLIPFNPIERGDVWNLVGDYGGSMGSELESFYRQNQSGVEALSGIGGAIATAYVGSALLLPRIGSALASSTAITGSTIWKSGAAVNAAVRARVAAAQIDAVQAGQAFNFMRTSAGRQALGLGFAKGAAVGAAEEALIVGALNSNELIWSNDMSDNLFWGAVGIGLGGTLSSIAMRAELRAQMNSPQMILARQDAFDAQSITRMREAQVPLATMKSIKDPELLESANFTAIALDARRAVPQGAHHRMKSLLDTWTTENTVRAEESLQRIANKGIPGVQGSNFRVNGGYLNHIVRTGAYEDPMLLYGANWVGAVPEQGLDYALKAFGNKADELIHAQGTTATDVKLGKKMHDSQSLLLVNGSWLPAGVDEAKEFAAYSPGVTKFVPVKNTSEFHYKSVTGKQRKVDESFNVRNFEVLNKADQMQALEGMRVVFSSMLKAKKTYVVPAKATWFQLDSALQYASMGGQLSLKNLPTPTIEGLRHASLSAKAAAIGNKNLNSVWDRLSFNLPLPSATERMYDSAGDTMRAALDAIAKGGTIDDAKQVRQQLLKSNQFEVKGDEEVALDGDFFNFNRSRLDGSWLPPVLGMFENESKLKPISKAALTEQLAERKTFRFTEMTRPVTLKNNTSPPDLVENLTAIIHTHPNMKLVSSVSGLADDQITGTGNVGSQLAGEVLTREMRFRDSPIMLAALRLRTEVNRITNAFMSSQLEQLGKLPEQLNSIAGRGSKELVNAFYSFAGGWDLKAQPIPMGNGTYGFQLEAKSQQNRIRLGRSINKDELLTNPNTGQPLVVDDLAISYITGMQNIYASTLKGRNRVRSALGIKSQDQKEWYVPPPNTKGKEIGFVVDADRRPVPGGAIIANTRLEFDSMVEKLTPNLKPGEYILTREAAASARDLYDEAALDWVNPGSSVAPGKAQTGAIFRAEINPNAVEDNLRWIQDQYQQQATDTMRVIFDEQIKIAKGLSASHRAREGRKLGSDGKNPESILRNIFDEYAQVILGQPTGNKVQSITGVGANWLEKTANGLIQTAWPTIRHMSPLQAARWINDVASKMGITKSVDVRSFDKLVAQLGPATPYANAMQYAEQKLGIHVPPEVKDIAQSTNKLTASLILRWFELAHPAMNMLGIITTMPSILRSGRAPITAYVGTPTGPIGVVDGTKIMIQSLKDLAHPSKMADWKFMVANGDASQSFMEFNQQMSLVKDRGSWGRVFLGKGSKQGAKGLKGLYHEKGVDGLVSLASDTSESWSRSWAHFAGLRLADLHGIQGMEARHDFAREVANAAIANYDPLNRPELFQSSFGSMFGLFMSYMQNYNQRMFRWMEQRDYAGVGRQLAMQSALFGVASNPMYNQLESLLMSAGITEGANDSEATLTDLIYAKFGPTIGAAIAQGGLQETGLALYARGDMNYRDVSLDPTRLMAGIGVMTSVASGFNELLKTMVTSSNSIDHNNRVAEIFARHMPNRVMKGIVTNLAVDGQELDVRGQVISQNKDFFESAVRILGLRSQRQQAEVEAFYANKTAQTREAARMDVLRAETRALLRQPNWEGQLQQVFDRYVKSGGMPQHFRTWIRDQVRAATSTRGLNALQKAMSNPNNHSEIWRYEAYGGGS